MKHAAVAASLLALAALSGSPPALAQAQYPAFTSGPVNLRAGPSRDYPIVAVLPAGFQVLVQGCLSDFRWCDIVAGYDRGWVYAGNILYNYDNNMQPIVTWGPMIGIGVIGFAFNDYWPRYYRNRPWYGERHRWADVRPPRYVAPLPPPPAQRPPGWVQPHPRPVPPPHPAPQVQPRPVPQPQPQLQPRPVPQPAMPAQPRPPQAAPHGQPHPGVRGAPAAVPAPHPVQPGPRGGERRPAPQQQEREHG
jgi:uncharacterized protein YraI